MSKFKTSSGHLNLTGEFFVVAREFSDLRYLMNTVNDNNDNDNDSGNNNDNAIVMVI